MLILQTLSYIACEKRPGSDRTPRAGRGSRHRRPGSRPRSQRTACGWFCRSTGETRDEMLTSDAYGTSRKSSGRFGHMTPKRLGTSRIPVFGAGVGNLRGPRSARKDRPKTKRKGRRVSGGECSRAGTADVQHTAGPRVARAVEEKTSDGGLRRSGTGGSHCCLRSSG